MKTYLIPATTVSTMLTMASKDSRSQIANVALVVKDDDTAELVTTDGYRLMIGQAVEPGTYPHYSQSVPVPDGTFSSVTLNPQTVIKAVKSMPGETIALHVNGSAVSLKGANGAQIDLELAGEIRHGNTDQVDKIVLSRPYLLSVLTVFPRGIITLQWAGCMTPRECVITAILFTGLNPSVKVVLMPWRE